MTAASSRRCTITLSVRTRRLLESLKPPGETLADALEELLEETFFSDAFYGEIERRWSSENRIPGGTVLGRAGSIATRECAGQ